MKHKNLGIIYVVAAYFFWGVLPVYWKQLSSVPAQVVLSHRVIWSIIFLGLVLFLQKRIASSARELFKQKILFGRSLAAIFVCLNWLTYVWAMGHGYISESGLGYFISPLLSVILAASVFNEKLSATQLAGITLVTLGVGMKVLSAGHLPWVALTLAFSWSLYCTVRKKQSSAPISSLFQEVLIMAPVLIFLMLYFKSSELLHWYGFQNMFLLLLSGPITTLPILMLVQGLKTVSLSSVALIQFLTPTLNLIVSMMLGESFHVYDLYAYLPIWLGVLLFAGVFNFFTSPALLKNPA